MPSFRKERVASLLQRELSRILREEVKDPRVGPFVTVTGVKVADDLRSATALWTVLGGDESRRREVKAGLDRSLGFIRSRVGEAVRMRFTPEVRFRYDAAFEDALRVGRLIGEVAPPPAPASEEPASGTGDEEPGDGE